MRAGKLHGAATIKVMPPLAERGASDQIRIDRKTKPVSRIIENGISAGRPLLNTVEITQNVVMRSGN